MDKNLIEEIKLNYGLPVRGTIILGNESFRYVYKLLTDSDAYILRLFPLDRDFEKISHDIEIIKFLEENDFPTQKLIKTINGEYISKIDGRNSVVTTYIKGDHPNLSIETMLKMGELMGILHNLDCKKYPFRTGWNVQSEIYEIRTKVKQLDLSKLKHSEIIPDVINALELLPSFDNLPQTIIHTDMHPKNMIKTSDNKYCFIDWDDAGIGTTILDLGYVLSQVCIGYGENDSNNLILNEDLVKAFLDGYYSQRDLSKAEKDSLIYAMQACALLYTIQYWQPVIDKINWERYKIEEQYKDKIRQLVER